MPKEDKPAGVKRFRQVRYCGGFSGGSEARVIESDTASAPKDAVEVPITTELHGWEREE